MIDDYIKRKPTDPSFSRGGADGYQFDINNKEVEIDYIESRTGHGGSVVSSLHTNFYYILDGEGEFIINKERFLVNIGQLVEIPPNTSFDYSGKMKMLLIMQPPFSPEFIRELTE